MHIVPCSVVLLPHACSTPLKRPLSQGLYLIQYTGGGTNGAPVLRLEEQGPAVALVTDVSKSVMDQMEVWSSIRLPPGQQATFWYDMDGLHLHLQAY